MLRQTLNAFVGLLVTALLVAPAAARGRGASRAGGSTAESGSGRCMHSGGASGGTIGLRGNNGSMNEAQLARIIAAQRAMIRELMAEQSGNAKQSRPDPKQQAEQKRLENVRARRVAEEAAKAEKKSGGLAKSDNRFGKDFPKLP